MDLTYHPVEQTEKFKAVIGEVTKEAEEELLAKGIPPKQRGRSTQLNWEIKRILKDKHGIDWVDAYTYSGLFLD